MKKLCLVLLSIVAFACYPALAQTADEQKAWMDYMTPGEIHKMLARSAGDWKEDVTTWMKPGAPPTTSSGTAKNEMIMGGRYLQTTHKGTFSGMPFEGVGITAYDNAAKKFITTWIDNFGTGIMTLEGKWDPKTNSIEFKGKTTDPITGKDVAVREVFKLIDDNNQVLEMYGVQDGKEYKSMQIKFTRQ
jgi:hypothetical protein